MTRTATCSFDAETGQSPHHSPTVGVQMVSWELGRRQPLSVQVCAVAVLIQGQQLLLGDPGVGDHEPIQAVNACAV